MAVQVDPQFAGSVLQQPNTLAFVQEKELGPGLLTIGDSCLSWTSDDQSELFSLEYPNISIHAISRDTSQFPHQCVYLLHCPQGESEEEEEGRDGEGEDEGRREEGVKEESGGMTEIRLVPPDINQLEPIFQAISECQTLYPDPEQMSSEDEEEELCEGVEGEEEVDLGGGDFFTSPEGVQHLTPEGQAVLQHLERVFQLPSPEEFSEMVANGDTRETGENGQFDDAEMI